jgi:hypothetical protein
MACEIPPMLLDADHPKNLRERKLPGLLEPERRIKYCPSLRSVKNLIVLDARIPHIEHGHGLRLDYHPLDIIAGKALYGFHGIPKRQHKNLGPVISNLFQQIRAFISRQTLELR